MHEHQHDSDTIEANISHQEQIHTEIYRHISCVWQQHRLQENLSLPKTNPLCPERWEKAPMESASTAEAKGSTIPICLTTELA